MTWWPKERHRGKDYLPLAHWRLLKEAKEKGLIKKVGPLIDALRQENVWISDPLYHRFLKEIGEA